MQNEVAEQDPVFRQAQELSSSGKVRESYVLYKKSLDQFRGDACSFGSLHRKRALCSVMLRLHLSSLALQLAAETVNQFSARVFETAGDVCNVDWMWWFHFKIVFMEA